MCGKHHDQTRPCYSPKPITPKRTPVLMAERRTEHYGVTQRAAGPNEPGFAVFKGETNSEVICHFFTDEGKDGTREYAKWKNGKETT